MTDRECTGRFAPSTTGRAHPGTLLAALLGWLDVRSRGGRIGLRLEDLDPDRSNPERVSQMQTDLAWLGLDWDFETVQSQDAAAHEAALDRLEATGRLYPCRCSRAQIRERAGIAPDGSLFYPGTCRGRSLPSGGWRATDEPLRLRVDEVPSVIDEGGEPLGEGMPLSDPVVRRRDGAVAYHLATVVDDAAAGVTRIVRGRDLASSTPVQVALQHALDLPTPAYRHHLLLLEERGGKLAKLHGAVDVEALRAVYDADALVGWLAWCCGILAEPSPKRPHDLIGRFDWARIAREDLVLRFDGQRLERIDR